jgi:hypothetical protein
LRAASAPCLAIGAGIDNDVALLTGWATESPALIALGMVAFLAAVTQAPIPSFIIVMEMVDGQAMVPRLMTAALGAGLMARGWRIPCTAHWPLRNACDCRRAPVRDRPRRSGRSLQPPESGRHIFTLANVSPIAHIRTNV